MITLIILWYTMIVSGISVTWAGLELIFFTLTEVGTRCILILLSSDCKILFMRTSRGGLTCSIVMSATVLLMVSSINVYTSSFFACTVPQPTFAVWALESSCQPSWTPWLEPKMIRRTLPGTSGPLLLPPTRVVWIQNRKWMQHLRLGLQQYQNVFIPARYVCVCPSVSYQIWRCCKVQLRRFWDRALKDRGTPAETDPSR